MMQRLRSTFKRSRTPTGAEMKSQSSLEVPKQVRSASFDEIQLEVERHDSERTSKLHDMIMRMNTMTTTTASSSSSSSPARSDAKRSATLRVPHPQSTQRSRSFDIYERTSLLSTSSRSSGSSVGGTKKSNGSMVSPISSCYHCLCVDEYNKLFVTKMDDNDYDNDVEGDANDNDEDHDDDNNNDGDDDGDDDDDDDDDDDGDGDDDDDYDDDDDAAADADNDGDNDANDNDYNTHKLIMDNEEVEQHFREGSPEIRVTLMTFDQLTLNETENVDNDSNDVVKVDFIPQERPRRLSRQEALTSFPIDLPSISGPEDDDDELKVDDDDDNGDNNDDNDDRNHVNNDDDGSGSEAGKINSMDKSLNKSKLVVRDIFLTVPELKRERAASVDSCFNNSKNGKGEGNDYCLAVPQQNTRSRSVDIVLSTDQQTRYKALLPSKQTNRDRGGREDTGSSANREPRSTPDWGPDSINGEHLWVPTAASGDFCHAVDCSKHGPRLKCAACRVMAHACCTSNLNFECKPSFRDVGVRQYREQTSTHHHWVHRRSEKGKCANCSKAFQSKLSFSSKEIVAVTCSWCKLAYHNKEACFNVEKIGENCELGVHKTIVVPPSWIVKLPRKGSFKSSLRKSPRKKKNGSSGGGGTGGSSRKKSNDKEKDDKDYGKLWVVKPIPSPNIRPVIVFINPKSGGNQGAKLLQKFQWLLNPRQVFDLTQGGPNMGLELFKKVPNLRVLACGGDGTVGWVLSILDRIGISPPPAVGVLPLGTGNDLARALGWGGGYTDEPIGKILSNIGDSETTLLDRWQVFVEKNPDANNDDDSGKGKENLPLNVVNNYFSLGVDAHIALEFHEAREAHPEKFNSRLRNKMFYGQMGGKDLVRRKWKDLSEFVTLECDGQDLTPKLKEHRVHAIVFLNIASYGGGTHPWGAVSGTREPSTEDGLFEVVGLTTYQLPLLQAGGHGTCITQCSSAKLVTTKTIPMQVDGEACRVLPSIIEIKLLNKATMLAKRRRTSKSQHNVGIKLESLKLPLMKIRMANYESYHSDKDRLKKTAVSWRTEPLELDATMDLESLRKMLAQDFSMEACCFLDSCTAERFFRIDRAQEQLHYVTDVASEAVYILEEDSSIQNAEGDAINITEPETAQASPCKDKKLPMSAPKKQEIEIVKEPEIQRGATVEKSVANPNLKKKAEADTNESNAQIQGSSKQVSAIADRSITDSAPAFISPRDRLFSLSSDVHNLSSSLLEKPCDGIIRAAKTGDLKSLKELHEHGFSLLSIDPSGQTALHHAARHGHKDIIRYLMACAPSTILNIVDNDKGQTALHKAAQQKRRTVCFMLVAGGATLTVSDRHGNTPRHLALIAEDRELAAYLASQEQFQLMTDDMQNL